MMNEEYIKRLDFDSDTFEAMKTDMNFILQRMIGSMIEKDSTEGMLRMSSYMSRGQKLIEAGKTPDAMRLVTRGFQHYAERVLKAIQPYAKADACMLVLILRHIADEIERNNPGTKEQVEVLKKAVVLPTIEEIEKVKRPNGK